ncbi:MAG TPA: hypothetical protein VKR59_14465 [Terriglobales bacterium]|nr:hypothetical protein [Terriglobales bacterium]
MKPISATLCLLVLSAGALFSQAASSSQTSKDAAYLMRLERIRHGEDVCVLVRGDGQYHLEFQSFGSIKIFEGELDADGIRQAIRLVSTDQLFDLEQKQIAEPLLTADNDEVMLAVLRPRDTWQQLTFPDSPSRKPYDESLVPLLDWFDRVQKRKGRKLSEEAGRNSCLPPRNLEFSARTPELHAPDVTSPNSTNATGGGSGSQSSAQSAAEGGTTAAAYALRMVESGYERRTIVMSCRIVSRSGAYHFVKQSRESNSRKVRSVVRDGTLNETQMAALRQILSDPGLKDPPPSHRPSQFEMQLTYGPSQFILWFPRDGALQEIEAWRSVPTVGGTLIGGMQDHGAKALLPLREWLKQNLDESKAIATTNPTNVQCLQEP